MLLLQEMVVYHHLLSLLDHSNLDLPAWAKIFLAIPHNRVEVTSLYCPLTTPLHLQPVTLFPHNGYRMPQTIRQLCLTDLQVHPLITVQFTIRRKALGTIDWTPIFVRGSKSTPIHSETSVMKKIIRDLSLRFGIYLSQARHLLYYNSTLSLSLSLSAIFTYT